MAFDYFLLIFIASIGVYQIISIPAKLKGLWFFNNQALQYIFGALTIIGIFGWFFTEHQRNTPPIVEGSQQLALFLGAIVAAYFATVILASIMEAGMEPQGKNPPQETQYGQGMEDLKTATVFSSILSRLRQKSGKEE